MMMKSLEDLQKDKLIAEIKKIKKETEQIVTTDSYNIATVNAEKIVSETNKLNQDLLLSKLPWYRQSSVLASAVVTLLSLIVVWFVAGGEKLAEANNKNIIADNKELKFTNDTLEASKHKFQLEIRNQERHLKAISNSNDSIFILREHQIQNENEAYNIQVTKFNLRVARFNASTKLSQKETGSLVNKLAYLVISIKYTPGTIPLIKAQLTGKAANGDIFEKELFLDPLTNQLSIPYGAYNLTYELNGVKFNKPFHVPETKEVQVDATKVN